MAPRSERWPILSRMSRRTRRTWQDPSGKWVRWETCGTFLRGRTGANSVLNKDKISVQFPSTLIIHHHRYILFYFTLLYFTFTLGGVQAFFHHLVPFYHHLLYSTSPISSIKHLLNLILTKGQRTKRSKVKYERWLGQVWEVWGDYLVV